MPLPSFISQLYPVTQIRYPGQILACRFSVAGYHDSDFLLTGIPFPPELIPAISKRKAEYLAGRYLARYIMRQAGKPDSSIASGKNREPCWPDGVSGSISHNHNTAICAMHIGQPLPATGIDIETIMTPQTASDLTASIISDSEAAYLHQQHASYPLLLTLVFSAKESLFKALYPQVKKYIGFTDASISQIDLSQQRFTLTLNTDLPPHFIQGQEFHGDYLPQADAVITLIYF